MSGTDKDCGRYHHGDLRNALIIAAADLIEEKGSLDFAMVDAARRAGVSSAAPYRHFRDKDALLQAVAEVAFLALSETAAKTAAEHPPGSTEALLAQGRAYIEFVTGHPAFYDLMWGDPGPRRKHPDDPEIKTSGFYTLVHSVEAWCELAGLKQYDALELSVKLWAMAHGLASLAMTSNIDRFIVDADIFTLFESSTNTFLEGLRADRQPVAGKRRPRQKP